MKSISALLSVIAKIFADHALSDPKRHAEELLCTLLECSRGELHAFSHNALTPEQEQLAEQWMQRRLQGEPLAYLAGKVGFYHCRIEVNRSVLIPRPETEILVDKIVSRLKDEKLQGKILWDLCCGSGCIGIALKKALPALTVYLSDESSSAIALSKRNAAANAVDVICLTGDCFSPFQGKKTDYLVCNPPYISEEEYAALDKEVKEFEPRLALVAGTTGLEFYQRLAQELPLYLSPHGMAWFEIGYQQGSAVQNLFQGGPWKRSGVENDWAGHNRFFFLENE